MKAGKIKTAFWILALAPLLCRPLPADQRDRIAAAAGELAQRSTAAAEEMYSRFRDSRFEISDSQQAVLFRADAFAAACRLFHRLAAGDEGYAYDPVVRVNLYSAFQALGRIHQELEAAQTISDASGMRRYDFSRGLNAIGEIFDRWPPPDVLADHEGKYVQIGERVYLVERRGRGNYVRRPFADVESLWRYNYDRKREKDPWKYAVKVSRDLLDALPEGDEIRLNFEGCLVMAQEGGAQKTVYLIEGGRKRPIPSPAVLNRYGGWKSVYELPRLVITAYVTGDPVE